MIYVMSDLHGCYDKYIDMINKIMLKKEDTLYVLGDILDRGPNGLKIALDIANMNAYNPTTNVFMNRFVTGNYNNFNLLVGKNTISWTGTITQIQIENYSRWI